MATTAMATTAMAAVMAYRSRHIAGEIDDLYIVWVRVTQPAYTDNTGRAMTRHVGAEQGGHHVVKA